MGGEGRVQGTTAGQGDLALGQTLMVIHSWNECCGR